MVTALFIGRFQPFHLGHLSAIKEILKKADKLIIGIGSSQFSDTKDNPFSYKERKEMIKQVLLKENIKNYNIFPIKDTFEDDAWIKEIKKSIPRFDIAFTGNPHTFRAFKDKEFKLERIKIVKNINGSLIRDKMINNKGWDKLVHVEVVKYIHKIDGVDRIRKIFYNIQILPASVISMFSVK